jgi:hypothetical protein
MCIFSTWYIIPLSRDKNVIKPNLGYHSVSHLEHALEISVSDGKLQPSGSRLVGGALIYSRQPLIHHDAQPIISPAVPVRGFWTCHG